MMGTASVPNGEFCDIIILVNGPNFDFVLHSQIQLSWHLNSANVEFVLNSQPIEWSADVDIALK